jgi:hypothetical protein
VNYSQDVMVIDHLLASGEMLPSQLPIASSWSPEKRLAAAVLSSALITIRDHCADPAYRELVDDELAWLHSDVSHAFGFRHLCDLFDLDPAWVRQVVARWRRLRLAGVRTPFSLHRYAA